MNNTTTGSICIRDDTIIHPDTTDIQASPTTTNINPYDAALVFEQHDTTLLIPLLTKTPEASRKTIPDLHEAIRQLAKQRGITDMLTITTTPEETMTELGWESLTLAELQQTTLIEYIDTAWLEHYNDPDTAIYTYTLTSNHTQTA